MPENPWADPRRLYPCTECGAEPGDPCITKNGNRKRDYHAVRGAFTDHCHRCGEMLDPDQERGSMCRRCALIRRLEIERATTHIRRT